MLIIHFLLCPQYQHILYFWVKYITGSWYMETNEWKNQKVSFPIFSFLLDQKALCFSEDRRILTRTQGHDIKENITTIVWSNLYILRAHNGDCYKARKMENYFVTTKEDGKPGKETHHLCFYEKITLISCLPWTHRAPSIGAQFSAAESPGCT